MDTDIKRVRRIIEEITGVNLGIKTRKRNVIHARRMYYKILNLHTNLSLDAIGKTLEIEQNHATVLHQVKMFDTDYNQDMNFVNIFRKIINACNGVTEPTDEDKLKDRNIELNEQISYLKKELEELKKEVEYLRPKAIQPKNQQAKVYHCTEGISNLIY